MHAELVAGWDQHSGLWTAKPVTSPLGTHALRPGWGREKARERHVTLTQLLLVMTPLAIPTPR